MCSEGELMLVQRFRDPDAACTVEHYAKYVNQVLANEVTMPELAELCRVCVCDVEHLAGKIVAAKMAKKNNKGKAQR